MATYPLKNISIGGNTYQIQGGEFYVIEVETQNTSASTFAAFPSKSHIISDSTVTVYDKDGNVQSSFDFTKLLSAPCVAHIITHGSGGNIDSYAGLIGVDTSSAPTYFSISFESDWKSPSSVPTRYGIILDILQGNIDAVDGYALEVGGGGGGGSAFEVTLCDQQYNPISVGQFDSSSTLTNAKLVNGGSAVSFDAIFTTWKTTDVIINVGTSYDISKRHFRVIAVSEGNGTSIAAVYIQSSPRYVNFEYSGGAWNMTKN